MSEQNEVVVKDDSASPDPILFAAGSDGVQDIAVIAKYPYQMAACQKSLIEWTDRKIVALQAEEADCRESYEIARQKKWASAPLLRAADRVKKRITFYEKLKAALALGHCIVPNFPVDLIAVRVGKKKPRETHTTSPRDASTTKAEILPAGEGRFVDDGQFRGSCQTTYRGHDGQERKQDHFFPIAFDEEIDFPFLVARPEVLTALARATADKVFDEIGLLPGKHAPRGDPILVGRIFDPTRSGGWNSELRRNEKRFVSFLIAWYIDTRDL
jgi:hypothetical protein